MTQKDLCSKAGLQNVSTFNMAVSRNAVTLTNLLKLANAAGYSVMIVNKSAVGFEPPIEITLDQVVEENQ